MGDLLAACYDSAGGAKVTGGLGQECEVDVPTGVVVERGQSCRMEACEVMTHRARPEAGAQDEIGDGGCVAVEQVQEHSGVAAEP
ncbi:hypothetical protein [Microlunatus flavus]|uniref:hypothetical protein n=1 Tax=Microlunatus flavus TaxID=1036181 RepID=UPI000B883839|nr:hypothetical protein [Microlunatus flavus]